MHMFLAVELPLMVDYETSLAFYLTQRGNHILMHLLSGRRKQQEFSSNDLPHTVQHHFTLRTYGDINSTYYFSCV